MSVATTDIEAVTTSVFESMLDTTLNQGPPPSPPEGPRVAGVIRLKGAFPGEVVVEMSTGLLKKAAMAMFQLPEAEIEAEHLEDALREITNMIGGNIKCLVPPPTSLSLPELLSEEHKKYLLPPSSHAIFHFGGAPVMVRLYRDMPSVDLTQPGF